MKRILLNAVLAAMSACLAFGSGAPCLAKEEPYGHIMLSKRQNVNEETETTIDKNQLHARSAVLMDADTGRVLFEKEGYEPLPMASTTKILTCILALENGSPDDVVEVSSYAASMPNVKLHIHKGERYKLLDLLYSLMLESHNDSAVAIAEHIGGSVEKFAGMMNEKAAKIGCKDSYFITPNGLDASQEVTSKDGSPKTAVHSTTARDLALIMSYCVKQSPKREEFLEITQAGSYQFSDLEGTRSFSCNNHNAFLNMMKGALSGKTGFTGNAGYCYVGALEREGRTFAVALLACGWPNNKTYKWADTKKLMKYGIENFNLADLSAEPVKEEWLAKIPVEKAQTKRLYGEAKAGVYVKDQEGAPTMLLKRGEKVQMRCSVKRRLSAPVQKDQEVGSIQYLMDETVVWERKICTKEGFERVDYAWYVRQALQGFFRL